MTLHRIVRLSLALLGCSWMPVLAAPADRELPRPEAVFGHLPGADRTLIGYDALVDYFQTLADRSDRVDLRRIGKTTQGRDLVMLVISTPENLARSARYREIAANLNDPRGFSTQEIDQMVAEGKVILSVSLNIHSDEIAISQMSPEWVYGLATGGPDSPARYLEDVIVLLFPSLNPDGQMMVTDWYLEQRGTVHEGTPLPWLYHPYAGHDNNRDWFMQNLVETRLVNRVLYREWHPQVVLDEHQMGGSGPRIFVPPYADPVAGNVHPLVHRGTMLLGSGMSMALEQAGKAGVIYGYSFDAYWPGGMRSTPAWKNTIGILTETASAHLMSPRFVDRKQLTGGRKGLPEYKAQINFPHPWAGGWWRPRDIVEYAHIVTTSALESCSLYREDLLRNRAAMSWDAVRRGETEPPYAYVIPPDQHDRGTSEKLVLLLQENGIEIERSMQTTKENGVEIVQGSYVIRAAQPYRPLLLEMMEPQIYPEVKTHAGSKDILAPYDVTAWTLPYLMGVRSQRINTPVGLALVQAQSPDRALAETDQWTFSPHENDSYIAIARVLRQQKPVRQLLAASEIQGARMEAGSFLIEMPRQELNAIIEGLKVEPRSVTFRSTRESSARSRDRSLALPRVGIYQSWVPNEDEGWTRFMLDDFDVPYTVLHNAEIQAGDLNRTYDVVLFPDQDREEIVEGRTAGSDSIPPVPEFAGGVGEKGVRALREFVQKGGTLMAFGDAVDFAIHDLRAPCGDAAAGLSRDKFSTPGTLVRTKVNTSHPLGFGMPETAMVFRTQDPVLTASRGRNARTAAVVTYDSGPNLVASGWARGAELLHRKGALVEAESGKGAFVLFGFRPQFRGQTHGTYKLILNALFDAGAE